MEYTITNMNKDILKQIISWKYDGEYNIYNMESYDNLVKRNASITKVENKDNYLCYHKDNKLIAYTNIIKKENWDIFIGIGISPECCGKGLGKEILNNTVFIAKERYPDSKLVLQVRAWNKRAIKCYQSVGFNIVNKRIVEDHNGVKTEFVFMEYMNIN